jgi:hypothetical protein
MTAAAPPRTRPCTYCDADAAADGSTCPLANRLPLLWARAGTAVPQTGGAFRGRLDARARAVDQGLTRARGGAESATVVPVALIDAAYMEEEELRSWI